MTDALYKLYKNSREDLARYLTAKGDEESATQVNQAIEILEKAIESMERLFPRLKEQYERDKDMQEGFTLQQVDFIRLQIAEWYLEWKGKITTEPGAGHRLGYAKEQLKERIFGER